MPSTISSSNKSYKVLDISNNASSCIERYFPDQIWCNNCYDVINLGPRKIQKLCGEP